MAALKPKGWWLAVTIATRVVQTGWVVQLFVSITNGGTNLSPRIFMEIPQSPAPPNILLQTGDQDFAEKGRRMEEAVTEGNPLHFVSACALANN